MLESDPQDKVKKSLFFSVSKGLKVYLYYIHLVLPSKASQIMHEWQKRQQETFRGRKRKKSTRRKTARFTPSRINRSAATFFFSSIYLIPIVPALNRAEPTPFSCGEDGEEGKDMTLTFIPESNLYSGKKACTHTHT